MPGPAPTPTPLTDRQRAILEQWTRAHTTEKRLDRRASIILCLADGLGNTQTAHKVRAGATMVNRWRTRWQSAQPQLAALETDLDDKALARNIAQVFVDAPGRGVPPKFTAEQITLIIKLATTPPENFDRPISHWTTTQLAQEAVKQGIVKSISPRQVGRFLKSGGPQASSHQILGNQSRQG